MSLEFHSNEQIVDEVERGLKVGYWDKALIPELKKRFKEIEKKEKLLELYKEFLDKLNIQLRNTFDIDYIYPHEFIIGYDIKSEDKELVKLFKQIKELENE